MTQIPLDDTRLEAVVRQVLGCPDATLAAWTGTPITAGWGTTELGGGVVRLRGMATCRNASCPWSLILKALPLPLDRLVEGPAHFAYRRRESLLYQSGLLADLPGGIAAPRCYGVEEDAGMVRLWLEDVADMAGEHWPLERFGLAARHLGAFNGAYLTARSIPDAPWLAHDWLRQVIGYQEAAFTQLAMADLALEVRREWPEDLRQTALDLWARRADLLALLDDQPPVFCHRDASRRNLLARRTPEGRAETVAIDWALAGPGALGEDLASLVIASVILGEVAREQLPELETIAFAGYLAGLADAGWHGPAEVVRRGYLAAATLRYGLALGPLNPPTSKRIARTERTWGVPYAVLQEHMVAMRRSMFLLGEEVLRS